MRPPLYCIRTTTDLRYSGHFTLPAGEYDVDHESPWGPVVTVMNSLGHMLVVPREYVAKEEDK